MNELKTEEIYTFKLTNGEEFVAKIQEKTTDCFTIKQPISMIVTQQGLQMMPSMFSTNVDKNVVLNISSIAMVGETRDDVRNKYIEITTGIAPVSKQIITG